MSVNEQVILLESGTNELEIVVFTVGGSTYGINVMKVREIINPVPVTEVPNVHPHVSGIIRLRGEVLTLIDMSKILGVPASEDPKNDKYIVAELNKMKVAFHVHNVSRIYRISWEQIEKPSKLYEGEDTLTIGVVKMEEQMVLLLDYEKILVDINPESGINVGQLKELGVRERSTKKILVADDSAMLRDLIQTTLNEAGYENLDFFDNGQMLWNRLEGLVEKHGENVTDEVQAVITDIEMPQMDGHHLTRLIKEHPILSKIPVIIFSSLISPDLRHKGEKVGADGQVTKPEIVKLVNIIDSVIL
ncbi:MAG TPA: chemotaxis protein [Massilibacterium sp.]|nr:chemotaxis protein [Massilibacterium sp.]